MHRLSYYNESTDFKWVNDYPASSYNIVKDIVRKLYISATLIANIRFFRHTKTGIVQAICDQSYTPNRFFLYFSDDSLQYLHRISGPAWTHYHVSKDVPIDTQFFVNGIAHRDNGPQQTKYFSHVKAIREEIYRKNGQTHRDEDKPAYIQYFAYGPKKEESYYKEGMLHRENDKPTIIKYHGNGNALVQMWHKNDLLHRLSGPATIDCNFKKPMKKWFINNKPLNRTVFPAFENGVLVGKVRLTKSTIVEAMLFDREYGSFLQAMHNKLYYV